MKGAPATPFSGGCALHHCLAKDLLSAPGPGHCAPVPEVPSLSSLRAEAPWDTETRSLWLFLTPPQALGALPCFCPHCCAVPCPCLTVGVLTHCVQVSSFHGDAQRVDAQCGPFPRTGLLSRLSVSCVAFSIHAWRPLLGSSSSPASWCSWPRCLGLSVLFSCCWAVTGGGGLRARIWSAPSWNNCFYPPDKLGFCTRFYP